MDSSTSTGITLAAFDNYNTALQTVALKATKHAVQLPSDIAFHRSVDRSFAKEIDACSSRVLSLTNRLLSLVSTADTSSARGKGKGKGKLEDDVVDNFHAVVVDSMDQLLERAVRNALILCRIALRGLGLIYVAFSGYLSR